MFATHYRCLICGTEYALDEVEYVCPQHGAVGTLDVIYDYEAMRRRVSRDSIRRSEWASMWRYLPLLPVRDPALIPPLEVGWTPLYHARRLATSHGFEELWLKDDTRNPTGSLKDRASAMAVLRAREQGYETITTASTGNAAAALAGVAASVGLRVVIFVPRSAPEAKLTQLLVYGAEVHLVDGPYDEAFERCLEATEREGWYCRNTGFNPWMTEGKKTAAYEIAEQLGWEAPDAVVVSVGDGSIIGGLHKGFFDLLKLGWTERMPRLVGVQAAGSDACRCPSHHACHTARQRQCVHRTLFDGRPTQRRGKRTATAPDWRHSFVRGVRAPQSPFRSEGVRAASTQFVQNPPDDS